MEAKGDADFLPPSLLDTKKARGPSPPLTRIMVVAGVEAGDLGAVSGALAKAVSAASVKYKVTGLALYQHKAVVAVAELFHDATQQFLEALRPQPGDGARGLRDVRVVVGVEDCPFRMFEHWAVYDAPVGGDADLDKDDVVNTSYATYAGLLELGNQMRDLAHAGGSAVDFAEVRRKNAHLLPPTERILALSKSADFMTAAEYLDFHFAPLEVMLDSERVWPLPAVLDVEGILQAQMGQT